MDTALAVALAAGVTAIASAALTYRASTKATKVDEQQTAIEWSKEIRADAAEARREAHEARAQVREMGRELTEVKSAFDELVAYARRVVRSIHEPGQSIEHLRETVPPELPRWPERNGSAR